MFNVQRLLYIEHIEDLLVDLCQSLDLVVFFRGHSCRFRAFYCKIFEKTNDPNAFLRMLSEYGFEYALDDIIFNRVE